MFLLTSSLELCRLNRSFTQNCIYPKFSEKLKFHICFLDAISFKIAPSVALLFSSSSLFSFQGARKQTLIICRLALFGLFPPRVRLEILKHTKYSFDFSPSLWRKAPRKSLPRIWSSFTLRDIPSKLNNVRPALRPSFEKVWPRKLREACGLTSSP